MKGELEKVEDLLSQVQAELQRTLSLIEERQSDLSLAALELKQAAAAGDVDKVIAIQSRLVSLGKLIDSLSNSQKEHSRRIESIEKYLNALRARLEELRQQAGNLLAEGDQSQLARVKVQIEAITGAKA